jgi:hypothetical protein
MFSSVSVTEYPLSSCEIRSARAALDLFGATYPGSSYRSECAKEIRDSGDDFSEMLGRCRGCGRGGGRGGGVIFWRAPRSLMVLQSDGRKTTFTYTHSNTQTNKQTQTHIYTYMRRVLEPLSGWPGFETPGHTGRDALMPESMTWPSRVSMSYASRARPPAPLLLTRLGMCTMSMCKCTWVHGWKHKCLVCVARVWWHANQSRDKPGRGVLHCSWRHRACETGLVGGSSNLCR